MANLRRSIASMNALATFEAAARLGSFTLAAAELGVTQAAVSRQVKALEDDLNAALFTRAHRRVELTPAGRALAGCVSTAFDSMGQMIDTIRRPQVDHAVSIGATLAFSHFWIMPRLSEFRAAHPEIGLKLVAQDAPADLRHDRLDTCIRFSRPPIADGRSVANLPDRAFPVCSPGLLGRLGFGAGDADLARLPLIASDTINPRWLTWGAWARAVGAGPDLIRAAERIRVRFNHYTDSIDAALNGEGVALGWGALLARHMAEGRLVQVGTRALVTEERYHLLVPLGRPMSPACALFVDWVASRFADERDPRAEAAAV